jgi:hypothetical protein
MPGVDAHGSGCVSHRVAVANLFIRQPGSSAGQRQQLSSKAVLGCTKGIFEEAVCSAGEGEEWLCIQRGTLI